MPSNLQIIEELCGILRDMADVIEKQQNLLLELEATDFSDDVARVRGRYENLLGADEWPDDAEYRATHPQKA